MGYIEELRKIVGHRPLIFVGAVVIIVDEKGRVLLQQRTFPKGAWGIPGGLMELGESTEDTACREVYEETKLKVDNLKLLNIYSGPQHFTIAENGDEFYIVTAAYHTKSYSGKLEIDHDESIRFEFFHKDELPHRIVKTHKLMLDDFFNTQHNE